MPRAGIAPEQCCSVCKARTSLSLVSSSIVAAVVLERGELLTYCKCDGPPRGHLLLEAWSKPGENAGFGFHGVTEGHRVEGPCRGLEFNLLHKAGPAPKVRVIRASGLQSSLGTLQGWRSHHYGSCHINAPYTQRRLYFPYMHQNFPCGNCAYFLLSFCHSLLCLPSPNPSLGSGKLKFGLPKPSLFQAGASLLSFQPQRSQVTAWAVFWDRDVALRVCSWCYTPAEVALFT